MGQLIKGQKFQTCETKLTFSLYKFMISCMYYSQETLTNTVVKHEQSLLQSVATKKTAH